MEPTIRCPKCRTEIRLTEAMAGPLLEAERARLTLEVSKREAELTTEKAQFDAKVALATRNSVEQIRKKIEAESAVELEKARRGAYDLEQAMRGMEAKLAEAQDAQ